MHALFRSSDSLTHGVNGNIVGIAGSGTIDIQNVLDPHLADYGGPTLTHALVAGSPAIDAGDSALRYDQRGSRRMLDGNDDGQCDFEQPTLTQYEEDDPMSTRTTLRISLFTAVVLSLCLTESVSAKKGGKPGGGLALDKNLEQRNAKARCGLQVVDLKSGDVVHGLRIDGSIQELYDVVILPGVRQPKASGFLTNEIHQHVWLPEGHPT